jgi:hypothetical protein
MRHWYHRFAPAYFGYAPFVPYAYPPVVEYATPFGPVWAPVY